MPKIFPFKLHYYYNCFEIFTNKFLCYETFQRRGITHKIRQQSVNF